jgi:protocatechuate 3,4-dioxygenase beta subunit
MRYMFLVAFFAALSSPALALPSCAPSNRVATENYPGARAINPSNNLVLPAGKAIAARGQKITIIGKVLDKRCAPVTNAVVELWQQNPYGSWVVASDAQLAGAEPTFAGAGRTYTNMDGEFTFFTAFPAASGQRAPFVNIRIARRGLPDFATAVFFAGDQRNDRDGVFSKLAAKTRQDASLHVSQNAAGELVGTLQIVLPANAPYRTF